jgi:hypothetical protein
MFEHQRDARDCYNEALREWLKANPGVDESDVKMDWSPVTDRFRAWHAGVLIAKWGRKKYDAIEGPDWYCDVFDVTAVIVKPEKRYYKQITK